MKLGVLAREVVAKRLAITAAVTALASSAVGYGWVTPAGADHLTDWISRGLDLLGAVVGVAWVRSGVTPADPNLAPLSLNGHALIEHVPLAGVPPAD